MNPGILFSIVSQGRAFADKYYFLQESTGDPIRKIKEDGEMEMYHDEIFDVDVYSYTNKVDFVQVMKLKTSVKTKISGTVEFMACTREQCLTPQKVPFTIKIE